MVLPAFLPPFFLHVSGSQFVYFRSAYSDVGDALPHVTLFSVQFLSLQANCMRITVQKQFSTAAEVVVKSR